MPIKELQRITIPVKSPVKSLCWDGDTLIDWVRGIRFALDGTTSRLETTYNRYRFDRAIVLANTQYAIIYEGLGTKGLILKKGEPVREINRSYYCAYAYEYPIAAFLLPDGTPAIAHCPDEYNKLEIEEIESGRRLTNRSSNSIDFFHSRLQFNATGEYLISAGWVWQPFDVVQVFRIPDVLQNPILLDEDCSLDADGGEIHSVAFKTNTSLLYTTEREDSEPWAPVLTEFDLSRRETVYQQELESTAGILMPAGAEHVVGFFESPKVFETRSGKVTLAWPELRSGKQNSSISDRQEPVPPLAIDCSRMRFAVASQNEITVVQLELGQ